MNGTTRIVAIVAVIAVAAMAIGIGYAYTAQTEITDNDVESTYILISAEASETPAASDYQSKFNQGVEYDTRVWFDAQNDDHNKLTNYKVRFNLLDTTQIKIQDSPEKYIQATALGAAVLQVTDQNGLAPRKVIDETTGDTSDWFFMNISVPVEDLDSTLVYYVKITAGNEERAKDLIPTEDDLNLTPFERHGDNLWASVPVKIVDENADNKYTVCIAVTAPEGTQVDKYYKELPTKPELILDDATFAFSVASESLVGSSGDPVIESRMVSIDVTPAEGLELDGIVIPIPDEKNDANIEIATILGFAWKYTPATTPTSEVSAVSLPESIAYTISGTGAVIDSTTGVITLTQALEFGRHAYTVTVTQTDAQNRTIVKTVDIIFNPVHTIKITESEKFVIECDAGLIQTVGDDGDSATTEDQKISDIIVLPGAQYRFLTNIDAAKASIQTALSGYGTFTVVAADGKITISGTLNKDIDLTSKLEDVMEKVYYATLTPGFGYSFTDITGADPVSGAKYVVGPTSETYTFTFKISIDAAYDSSAMDVTVNGATLTSDTDGVYTVNNMTSDVVIKVTGVVPAQS